jgi:ABC-2 type transport system ATP-binding protein
MDAPETVLVTHDLSKSYGPQLAVDQLNLEVRRGEIFGFLGPNGAGKTTTMRMALGLIRPSAGWVEIFGRNVRSAGTKVLPEVGPLVETPALYSHLSGRDNLRVFAAELGGVSTRRIDELLELTDLKSRQRDRVAKYSLGMRQRLGLAIALLHDPKLLMLDEPANGLDPAGIKDTRALLRRLRDEGKTVFLSSHVLGEVERICDRVGILRRGRLVFSGEIETLRVSPGTFRVEVGDAEGALAWIRDQPWGREVTRDADGALLAPSPTGSGSALNVMLCQAGFPPESLGPYHRDLEEIFLDLTGDDQ